MRGHLGGSVPNSDTRSIVVSLISSMGDNVRDGKVEDDKVIFIAIEAGSSNTEYGKDVVSKGGDVGDDGGMTCGAKVSTDV